MVCVCVCVCVCVGVCSHLVVLAGALWSLSATPISTFSMATDVVTFTSTWSRANRGRRSAARSSNLQHASGRGAHDPARFVLHD